MVRTETQSAESDAPVTKVVALLADATRLPQWAPGFADQVGGDADAGWQVTKDGQAFTLKVAVDRDAGTADYLREVAPGREGGAYIRAVPRPGGGSVIVMTLPLLPGVDPADTAATLAGELTALVSLAERRSTPGPGTSRGRPAQMPSAGGPWRREMQDSGGFAGWVPRWR